MSSRHHAVASRGVVEVRAHRVELCWSDHAVSSSVPASGCWFPVGVFPDREERGRTRPLPGATLAGLVSPHHPGHARARVPDHHPSGHADPGKR